MKNRSQVLTKKRLHLFWSGRVQGVGFRYTTESVALELKLTGWVMNLPDGRVEAVVEGRETELKEFLEKMNAGPMKPYIRGTLEKWSEFAGEFNDFRIRFF